MTPGKYKSNVSNNLTHLSSFCYTRVIGIRFLQLAQNHWFAKKKIKNLPSNKINCYSWICITQTIKVDR